MFTEETYPALATVDQTFSGSTTLDLSKGKTVELHELSQPGVSSTQTVAFIPELNALIVGDLVHHKMRARLEGGSSTDMPRRRSMAGSPTCKSSKRRSSPNPSR